MSDIDSGPMTMVISGAICMRSVWLVDVPFACIFFFYYPQWELMKCLLAVYPHSSYSYYYSRTLYRVASHLVSRRC